MLNVTDTQSSGMGPAVELDPESPVDVVQLQPTDFTTGDHHPTMPSASPTYYTCDLDGIEMPCNAYDNTLSMKPATIYREEFQEQQIYPNPWEYIDHVTEPDCLVPGSTSYTYDTNSVPVHSSANDIDTSHFSDSVSIPAQDSANTYQQTFVFHGTQSPVPSNDSIHSHDVMQSYLTSQSPDLNRTYDGHSQIHLRTSSPIHEQSPEIVQTVEHYSVQTMPDVQGNKSDYYAVNQQYSDPSQSSYQIPVLDPISQHYVIQEQDISKESDGAELMSWITKHPDNWTAKEVLDWLYYTADKSGLDCSRLRGESFRTLTGAELCLMGPEDFSRLEPTFGRHFYSQFRQLLGGLQFSSPHDNFLEIEATYPLHELDGAVNVAQGQNNVRVQGQHVETYSQYPSNVDVTGALDYGMTQNQNAVEALVLQGYDYTPDFKFDQVPQYGVEYQHHYRMPERPEYRRHTSDMVAKYVNDVVPRKRGPGRPRVKNLPTEEELQAQRDKKMKGQHLWQFIYEILNNPMYNPQILKWENQTEGVFRFIQSETVAHLWGTQKNNENMTYEKLSRAMRHYYKRGILERVEGRRLVYKFSRVTLDRMRERKTKCHSQNDIHHNL